MKKLLIAAVLVATQARASLYIKIVERPEEANLVQVLVQHGIDRALQMGGIEENDDYLCQLFDVSDEETITQTINMELEDVSYCF